MAQTYTSNAVSLQRSFPARVNLLHTTVLDGLIINHVVLARPPRSWLAEQQLLRQLALSQRKSVTGLDWVVKS